ncbi:DUF962 domain-containing protein [Aliikangiella coralliicola]|uniref:DUF962 domain-containing protein n=1 Tax=Aliikangiella coralliicola TaxID=2592383 RepID=A0A545U7Y7_9GAMM|nr:Mpo1-like protein [Aliikangiella coralliicola]TQV85576.1 DUF962 domain-containing protein [Aliikangiella coralliicola]
MKTLIDQLSKYAEYHRDPRNIATHFVGIPLIVVSIAVLLSRPSFELFGIIVSPAVAVALISVVYYLMLDLFFGFLMTIVMFLSIWAGQSLAAGTTESWLGWGIGLFVVGWIIQFIGHYYEGKKPAFVDDIMGLVIGPLFVVAEAMFLLGLRKEVQMEIEKRAGVVKARNLNTHTSSSTE